MNRLKGMFDIHADAGYYAAIKAAIQAVAHSHHLARIETPILESSDLFHRGMGADTDVIRKETYTFNDRASRSLTLRPEGTAGVVRAFIEAKLYARPEPVKKFYYDGPMFRYERPQKGRFRQFHQMGVEVFAEASPSVDADLIHASVAILEHLGLTAHLELNQLSNTSKPDYKAALKAHLKPHLDSLCADCQTRYADNPLRILDCKIDATHTALQSAPMPLDYLSDEETAYFNALQDHLKALEIPFTVNNHLVRGLDYYTGMVFELKVDEAILGAQNTVAGGGRYDDLVHTLGGPALGATGFAFGIERLVVALKAAEIAPLTDPLDLYVMVLDASVTDYALQLVKALRHAGCAVMMSHHDGSMKKQFKTVTQLGAAYAAILGPDELASGTVTFKHQASGTAHRLNLSDTATMTRILHGGDA